MRCGDISITGIFLTPSFTYPQARAEDFQIDVGLFLAPHLIFYHPKIHHSLRLGDLKIRCGAKRRLDPQPSARACIPPSLQFGLKNEKKSTLVGMNRKKFSIFNSWFDMRDMMDICSSVEFKDLKHNFHSLLRLKFQSWISYSR